MPPRATVYHTYMHAYVCIRAPYTHTYRVGFTVKRLSTLFLPRTSYVLDHYLYLDFWWNFALSAALPAHGNTEKSKKKKKKEMKEGTKTRALSNRQAGCSAIAPVTHAPMAKLPTY